MLHNVQVPSTWRGGGVAGEKVINIMPDGIRPSDVYNEVEGVGIAEKLSGGTASAEREKKVEEMASCQFTVDEERPCGAKEWPVLWAD